MQFKERMVINMNNKKIALEEKNKILLAWLSSPEGTLIRNVYFRFKLYQGGADVSFDEMLKFLSIKKIEYRFHNGDIVLIVRTGEGKNAVLDKMVKKAYLDFRESLLVLSKMEMQVLSKYTRSTPNEIVLNVQAKQR